MRKKGMPFDVVQVGTPVLRERARPLERHEILAAETADLIEKMRETMRHAPGVGLAAPQIGLPLQLAVIEDKPDYLKGYSPERLAEMRREAVPFHVIINPKIVLRGSTAVEFEGCLSLEGFLARVPRATEVYVEALDEKAEPLKIEAQGWYARILQHEIDHLKGALYIDRMESQSFTSGENLARFGRR